MTTSGKARSLIALALGIIFSFSVGAWADPCLVVYPDLAAKYHYDVNEYYTVSAGHPLYDPMYDRGGEVLIDRNTDQIAEEVYQIPNLAGFKMSTDGEEGYFFIASTFELFIDGFNNQPTLYENIILVFDPNPSYCPASIWVDGDLVTGDSYPIGDLMVATPTTDGNNYSDTITKTITWTGCYGVRIWAFADTDYNGQLDGNECFTAFSHDSTVPNEESTWGVIKNLYRD